MNETKNSNPYIGLLIWFGGILIALTGAAALATYIIDPFFHYHAPLPAFPYQIDDQINQNPGMAENLTYDSFITGSSMTVNFDTEEFEAAFGKTIKLCYDGSYPKNNAIIMDYVFNENSRARKAGPVKNAFLNVDLLVYTADPEETKFPLTDYLYDNNPFNDIQYLLNKDVLLDYIIKPILQNEPTALNRIYCMDWITEDLTGADYVLANYVPLEAKDEPTPADALIPATKINLEQNVLPYVEAHPETTFYFFYPAYSILFWNNVEVEQMLDARLAQSEYIGETLLSYDNVRVFYFSNCEDIITDLNNYTDYTHHTEEISSYEVQCMIDGTHEVQPGGMAAELSKMRDIVENYDFDALLGANSSN